MRGRGRDCLLLVAMKRRKILTFFYLCSSAQETLSIFCEKRHIQLPYYSSTEDCLRWWLRRGRTFMAIPILFHWYIWCNRNRKNFEDFPCSPLKVTFQIYSSLESQKINQRPPSDLSKILCPHEFHYPAGFFLWGFSALYL